MSQTGKVTPNLDHKTTKVLNLTVLQRIDPSIEGILTTAAHVTLYEFNIESNQWSRKDVEGSLFVVKRTTHPRFQFIVMNRRNTENLVENLLGDFEYEVQGPYLLYRNQSQEVNGIWFYNPRECEEIASLFTRILNAYSKVSPKSIVTSSKSEFEELEAPPSMSVFEGPPDPSSTASAATVAPGDNTIENFFSSVLNAGLGNSTSTVANSRQPNHSSAALPFSSHMPTVASSLASTQTPPLPFSSVPASMPFYEPADTTSGSSNRVTSLVKPSSFFTPVSSSSQLVARPISSALPTAPTLQTPLNLQRPQGTPMLQPPPPLTPPPSLTPFSTMQPVITKEKVRGALLMLAQDDQFIDMFHRAMLKVHHS